MAFTAILTSAFFLFGKEESSPPGTKVQEEIQSAEPLVLKDEAPTLMLSQESVEQSGVVIARAAGLPEDTVPRGMFLSKQVSFFPVGDFWLAIVGIDAKRDPGTYSFTAEFGEAGSETREIRVIKRDFPVTKLAVTPELEEQGYTPSTIAENIATVENKALQDVLKGYTPTFYANKEFTYPLDVIEDVGAYGNIRQSGDISLQHLGVDLDAGVGTRVYSINDGKVALSRDFVNYGKTLVIDHGYGIYSLYLHLKGATLFVGDSVLRGQQIGYSGNTGYSIAPHLHFSIKAAGESVDPLRFIETVNKEF